MTIGNPKVNKTFGRPEASADWPRFLDFLFEMPAPKVIAAVSVWILVIASLDMITHVNLSFGLFYIFPLLMGAIVMKRWQMLLLCFVCAFLREHLGPYAWDPHAFSRLFSTFITFGGVGLLLNEVARNRRLTLMHNRELAEEVALRKEAENQLTTLVESSPAAILSLDSHGRVLLANYAAGELFGLPVSALQGSSIRQFLPTLADILDDKVSSLPYRTATNCRGRKATGEYFLASIWFATYESRSGTHLAAIITDASDDLRDFQETSLQSLLKSTRVLVGSVSHEIRNMCAAIQVVHRNLGRLPGITNSEDYIALGSLAEGLARVATVELQSAGEPEVGSVNIGTLLDEFRIVMEPTVEADAVEFEITDAENQPLALGEHHSLLQVLLNLSRNSIRAMANVSAPSLKVEVSHDAEFIYVRVRDSGPGIKKPERLFHAFQQGADAVGLGLFISRALVRASGGELYHEPTPTGCTMCMRLRVSTGQETSGEFNASEIHA